MTTFSGLSSFVAGKQSNDRKWKKTRFGGRVDEYKCVAKQDGAPRVKPTFYLSTLFCPLLLPPATNVRQIHIIKDHAQTCYVSGMG